MRNLRLWSSEVKGWILPPQFWDCLDHLPHHHTSQKAALKMAPMPVLADRILLISQEEAIG